MLLLPIMRKTLTIFFKSVSPAYFIVKTTFISNTFEELLTPSRSLLHVPMLSLQKLLTTLVFSHSAFQNDALGPR